MGNINREENTMALNEETKLDNPVWHALEETHHKFAVTFEDVRFYKPEYCPFGGYQDISKTAGGCKAYAALTETFYVVGDMPALAAGLTFEKELVCDQMILEKGTGITIDREIITLKEQHQSELAGLVNRVQPGYFKKRTNELGRYYGIYESGKLVAVTGERMKMNNYTEVSAVVTHPEHTGKGYAGQLITQAVNNITREGKIPFLHVNENNTMAIRLYKKLGFYTRRKISFWQVGTAKILLLLLLLPALLSAQPLKPLTLGKPGTYMISKNEQKDFSIYLEKGITYTIHAEQKGIDIGLTLQANDGKNITYQDAPNGKYGPETITFTADSTATYQLQVKPLSEATNAEQGKFTLVINKKVIQDKRGPIIQILTPRQMKEDLKVFRDIREKANSGLYRYQSKATIDSLYNWAAGQVAKPLPILSFYKILLVLTDIEGSCHNATKLPNDVIAYLDKDKGFFPYELKNIEGHITANNSNKAIPLGSRILSINGIPDSSLIRSFYKYCTTDGYNQTAKIKSAVDDSYGWRFPAEYGIKDSFTIVFQPPFTGQIDTITEASLSIEAKTTNVLKKHSAPYDSLLNWRTSEKYSCKQLNATTMLLNFRVFDMADNQEDPAYKVFCNFLDSVFRHIRNQNISNLIIDVRNNPGGNDPNYETVFTHLTDKPFRENTLAYITFGSIPFPQYYNWNSTDKDNQKMEQKQLEELAKQYFPTMEKGRYLQAKERNPYYYPDSLGFKGNLYLLIDENVASAASHFASLVRGYTDARIVGMECTGGYYGHNGHFPVEYHLPNSKITTRFSIVYVEQDAPQKSTQPVGRGIIPDYKVQQSFDDFMRNEDTQMKYVLQLIEGK